MLRRYRFTLIALALVGLGASIYALVIHYRLLTDPSYTPACDISTAINCRDVLSSRYGTVFGLPVAAGGAIWSAAVLLLAVFGMRQTGAVKGAPQEASELPGRVAGYIFVLATIGLAAVFYLGYASFFVLGQACPICMTMYVCVAGIFLASAAAATSLTAIPARLGEDLRGLTRSHLGTTLAVAWLAASIALIVMFPRELPTSSDTPAAAAQETAPALETLTPEQQAEWDKFLAAQTPVNEPDLLPKGPVKVLVIKFNDYQCPSCRQTWSLYRGIFAKYEKEYPGIFSYETRDLPLEPECGLMLNHNMACEAAAAVRLAKTKNKGREMEEWLFTHQSFEMTRDEVKKALQDVAQISNFDAQYQQQLPAIRKDVQLATKLGVTGTPTFYINGIKLGSLRPAYFDAAIQYFLKKSGVAS